MTQSGIPLVFMHGWAFGPEIWAPIQRELTDRVCINLDFGYFSNERHAELPDRPFIAVGHSLGALWLLDQAPEQCRGMVLFNGFARFAAAADFPEGIAPRILTRMMRALKSTPHATVEDFRRRAGTDLPLPGTPRPERLATGLQHLQELDARQVICPARFALYCLAGTQDPIAPPALTRASLARGASIDWVEGGHLLPLTHVTACLHTIDRMMKRTLP
ncbi:alpha/beta fold hydrolase [Novacetimonas pomaceti]|uniref:alpha/beta fold hydrolase n=1 Tax=Novacetimonas pomaceti TaxID=2021998 RepID=UPI001C2CE601|nr:alpha/beta fold hydrolase [Novacetimonas pomaceti]MBV1832455.1 alpha/beta hydrolase [Novacetimonas pomaceti]